MNYYDRHILQKIVSKNILFEFFLFNNRVKRPKMIVIHDVLTDLKFEL